MKIVDLTTFKTLSEGTIATKYEPCIFGDLFIKGASWEDDFVLTYITTEIDCDGTDDFYDKLNDALKNNTSVPMSFKESIRDGRFNDNQLFAVWEKTDVEGLIAKLTDCLEV